MKRMCYFLLCILLIASMAISVYAASAVPEPVMEATESVVRVLAEYADGYATGSGFVIKSDKDETLIATNYHVVEGKPYSISVWLSEEETVSATILAYTNQKDMCILKLAYPVSLKPLSFAENGAKQGEAVYAVGFPGAADYLSDKEAHTSADATITDGIVSAVREATVSSYGTPTKILQINAAINSGNSGGPLFNANGEVVGINTYGINNSQGIFGAIDVSELKAFMSDNSIPIPDVSSDTGASWILPTVGVAVVICAVFVVIIVMKKRRKRTVMKTDAHRISLGEYMATHPDGIGTYDAVSMLLPVALQLRDLHNNGSAHLQVSPNTITIGTNGAILADATSAESDRYASGFAAPEIYKGASAGNLSDIYSFCAVLSYVASGKQPINSLSRAESEELIDGTAQENTAWEEFMKTGMALAPAGRFPSMQEVIIKISPYNVKPFVAEPAMQQDSSALPKKKSAKVKVAILVVCVLLLVAGVCGTYIGCYMGAKNAASNEDFDHADKLLFIPQITALHDPDLITYVEAGKLLTNRNYGEAKQKFANLGGYLNSAEMANEADYRHAAQYADANSFQEAEELYLLLGDYKDSAEKALEVKYREGTYILLEDANYKEAFNIFFKLSQKEYEKADEMMDETRYRWALALIDDEEYVEAFKKLETIEDYSNVDEIMNALTELLYLEGQVLYGEEKYSEARKHFNCIPDYSNSSKYITLMDARGNVSNPKQMVNKLLDIFYFEDASELLLHNQDLAEAFLVGTWKSSNSYYKIEWEEDGSMTTSNLPRMIYGSCYYFIEKGKLYVYKEKRFDNELEYRFELTSPDTLKVYCAKDGKTYILYR